MNPTEGIAHILKFKGVGPEGSRHLNPEQLIELTGYLTDDHNLITSATLLMAFLMLENQAHEKIWLEQSQSQKLWPQEHHWMFEDQCNLSPTAMACIKMIQKEVIDISLVKNAFTDILAKRCPDWIAAPFLEGMRLKRETYQENKELWQILLAHSQSIQVNLPYLVDLSDAYDGLNRSPLLAPFVACVLAEMGIPTVIHGAKDIAPKKGLCNHDVLKIMGYTPLQSLTHAKRQIENPEINWTYVDQDIFCPKLAALKNLRTDMVKRPFLATFEKMLLPIRAAQNTMIVGYTHKAYRTLLSELMKEVKLVDQFIVIRGVEGCSRPSMARHSLFTQWNGAELVDSEWAPDEHGLELFEEKILKLSAAEMAELGKQTLQGQQNQLRKMIENQCLMILCLLQNRNSFNTLAEIQSILDSGHAYQRLLRTLNPA